MKSIILILGDQLSFNISSLKNCDKENNLILMCEVMQECTTPKHHKKKIAFILSSMRHFWQKLHNDGFNVFYSKLDDPENSGSFKSEILRISKKYQINKIKITHPGEYRVLQELNSLKQENLDIEIVPDDRFLCGIGEFEEFAKGKKNLLMESFYHYMRLKHNILMDGKKPIGGKWNYDLENRKPLKSGLKIPKPHKTNHDQITKEVLDLVDKNFSDHFGDLEPFELAVTSDQAILVLEKFINERLINFGTYQDAMIEGEDFMFHSHISFYLNNGLLDPLEAIKLVEEKYKKGDVNINCAEGFIRQVLGWREYVRGVYWLKMPEYKELNFFEAKNKLPEFYWGGKTKMKCVEECVRNTKQNSYAHHIQRLMVLGNFALLASIDPKEVNEWYLIVYSDAFEWVELPNVSGMILFADGGILGTKPYAASGSYINKMSNYCKNCSYLVKEKSGENACPFNYLYWNFLIKNKESLSNNHRMSMTYKVLEKFDDEKKEIIKSDSEKFLNQIF